MSSSFLFVMADGLDDPERRAESAFVLRSYFKDSSDGTKAMQWLGISEDDHDALALQVYQQLRRIGLEALGRSDYLELASELAKHLVAYLGVGDVLGGVIFAARLGALEVVRSYASYDHTLAILNDTPRAQIDYDGCLEWGRYFIELSEKRNNVTSDLECARILLERAREGCIAFENRLGTRRAEIQLALVYWRQGGESVERALDIVVSYWDDEALMCSSGIFRTLHDLRRVMIQAGVLEDGR